MQRITTFLWFDGQAEEAANFYVSVFKNSRVKAVSRYPEAAVQASGQKKGSVMTVVFELDGQEFVAMNGGPQFPFTEAVSLTVNCETQEEIDHYWEKLSSGGGKEVQCGWLKDKYGLSWQVVPAEIETWLTANPQTAERVMQEVLKMKKLDFATLRKAAGQQTKTS